MSNCLDNLRDPDCARLVVAPPAGTQDRLAAPLDVEFLLESLSPGVVRRNLIIPTYEHLDFIWGIDAVDMLYEDVIRFLQQVVS